MEDKVESCIGSMARLTISVIHRACKDPSCWEEPAVYRALLVSGLSVLTLSTQLLNNELNPD